MSNKASMRRAQTNHCFLDIIIYKNNPPVVIHKKKQ